MLGWPSAELQSSKTPQCFADSTAELQTSAGINIRTKPVHWELHFMGFEGRIAPVGAMCRFAHYF